MLEEQAREEAASKGCCATVPLVVDMVRNYPWSSRGSGSGDKAA